MNNVKEFTGKVLRFEPDNFGIVKLDHTINFRHDIAILTHSTLYGLDVSYYPLKKDDFICGILDINTNDVKKIPVVTYVISIKRKFSFWQKLIRYFNT